MTEVGLCVVDRWQELPDDRPQVCARCERWMAGQLRFLVDGAPLLAVVASAEPTAAGALNLNAVDLATPGNPAYLRGVRDRNSQTGYVPAAAHLAPWLEDWTGGDVITADVASIARRLLRGLAWACEQYPHIAEFARDLRQVYGAVRVGLRRRELPRRYVAACRRCGTASLTREPGAKWIECQVVECQALYDSQDYAALVVEQLEAAARKRWGAYEPLTSREAAALAGVKLTVIRQWIARGKLVPDIGPWVGRRFLRIDVDRVQAEIENRVRALDAREREKVAA